MHPNIFLDQLWNGEEVDQVFVAMSFQPEFDARFKSIIKPAIESIRVNDTNLRANRVDESKSGDSIITEIVRGIAQSRIVLADLSALGDLPNRADFIVRNGNVMYELGLAHAVKSPEKVVIIRDDNKKLLFDISSIPHTTIDFSAEDAARSKISELIVDRIHEADRIVDIKLRNFVSAMTPEEFSLLGQLAKCPEGKITDLTIDVGGRRITPHPTSAGLLGLRSVGAVRAHHLTDSGFPWYSLTTRGRRLCKMLQVTLPSS